MDPSHCTRSDQILSVPAKPSILRNCRAKKEAELVQAAGDAAAAAEYQALLAAQEAERQAALQEMRARSAQRAEHVGKQGCAHSAASMRRAAICLILMPNHISRSEFPPA